MVVPYFEWTELKTEEDKMVYLWSLGRRVAANKRGEPSKEAAATIEEAEMTAMSDLSDVGESRL